MLMKILNYEDFYYIILFYDNFIFHNEENYTVGVVFKAMDSEHWLSVRSGMIEAARKHNMKLIVMSAENEIAYAQQNKIINDLLDNKIDALIVSTTNIFHTDDFMKNAKLKNIPVFMKRI